MHLRLVFAKIDFRRRSKSFKFNKKIKKINMFYEFVFVGKESLESNFDL